MMMPAHSSSFNCSNQNMILIHNLPPLSDYFNKQT